MEKKLRVASLCVQGGYEPKNGEPIEVPIIQSATFKYDNSEEMAMLFDLKKEGYFYTRLQNPTNDAVAKKIAQLEGGVGAVLTSSGQAANFYAVFNICEAGDHIVTSNEIYGGTFNLFGVTLKKLGIECTFVNPNASEEEIQKAFRPNTKVVFGDDGEDDERYALLNHLELHQVEGTAIIDESDSVGRYLTAVFEEGDGPTECDDSDEGPVAAYARLLQFQMSIPCQCHEDVAQHEEQYCIYSVHIINV